jgi:hypothetical protein
MFILLKTDESIFLTLIFTIILEILFKNCIYIGLSTIFINVYIDIIYNILSSLS